MFATDNRLYHCLIIPTRVEPLTARAKALAYYNTATITTVKSFIVHVVSVRLFLGGAMTYRRTTIIRMILSKMQLNGLFTALATEGHSY